VADIKNLVRVDAMVRRALRKASFGGDRSAAGRYAAEQRWKNHQKKEQAGGNVTTPPITTPTVRTTEEKLANGPQNFIFGLDQYGMPKMGTLDELKKRYGRGAAARSSYFLDKYGVKVRIVPVKAGSLEEVTQLGALQAIEEVMMNTENGATLVKNISLGDDGSYTYKNMDANGYYQSGYITLKQETIQGRILKLLPALRDGKVDVGQNLSFRFTQEGVTIPVDGGTAVVRTMCQRAGYAVMVHEFGHAIDMAGGGRRMDASSTVHYGRGILGLGKIPTSVSRYGQGNEFEYVAEAWTAWFLFGQTSVKTGFSADSYGELAAPILRPIFEDRKDVVKMLERSIDIADLPPEHPVIMFILAPFISSAALIKASFGGDRSAAGRYAAEQRWKGHVKGGKSASVVVNESQLSWLTKPTDTSSEDFTKRIVERLVEKFSFFELSAAVLVQLSMSYPKEGQQALRLLNAYKEELSGAKNSKEVGIIVNEIISRQGAQPRMYDSWETEELELIRLSGSIGDMESDSLTQADRLVHTLKQGWTVGSQKGRAQVAALTGQSLGASSNRNAEQDYERKDADELTKIMNTDEGYAAKQVLTALVKEVYDDTQRLIKEKLPEGTTHVRLFRGTALTEEQLRDAKDGLLDVAVTSSWTSSPKIAGDFRGTYKPLWDATGERRKLEEVKITALVPVGSIFAVGLQGFGGKGEREVLVLGPSVEVQRVVLSTEAVGKNLAALIKASFGGDRSAAGRYAAEQRWKGHVKDKPAGSPPSGGAGDFMRLINGTPQTYTVKGVIQVHGFGIDGGISRGHYDDLVKADPNEEGNSTGVWQTTAGEFRRMATSGELDLSPKWVDHVVRSLREHSDDTRVAVELGVDAIIVRNQPIVPIRPDQPHTAKDIVSIGQAINSSAQIDEDWGLNNDTDKKLTVNTSPRNKGPVKSGTLSRWEKGWETDYNNLPYCKEIASHAAYLMGQVDAPVERWGRDRGSRAPSEAMLAQDAKDLLASIHQGVEGQPVLWRGLEPSRSATKGLVDKAQVGDTLTLGLASTSRDAIAAAKYTQAYSGESKPILMRIEEGSKGVSLGDRALYRHDQEVITSGKFEVVGVQTVTVPQWQMPSLGVETIQPSERIVIAREALPKVKALLPPEQYAAIERSVEREARNKVEFEKKTVTVKIVSVRQTETFNPETEEFEANG
jgi:hypothetical protein